LELQSVVDKTKQGSNKGNPVAKHMRTFNKATVQRDRKKDAKRGYKKHSNAYENMQVEEGKYPVWNKARVALNKDKKSGKKKDYKVLSPADFLKGRKGPAENRSEEVEQVQESTGHVRMDRLSKSSQQKVINVLNVHKKNGSIDYDGTTDKGVSFKLKKPEHHSKIHSDLRKHGTGFDMHESLDNANTEKDTAQMKLRHANQKVRLAKKQEREKGAVAERKETDSAAKKPEKYTKSDGTIGTRMVPAHKEVQTESVEQVDELSVKTLSRYNDKASKDPKRAKGNNQAVGKIVKKTMQGESVKAAAQRTDNSGNVHTMTLSDNGFVNSRTDKSRVSHSLSTHYVGFHKDGTKGAKGHVHKIAKSAKHSKDLASKMNRDAGTHSGWTAVKEDVQQVDENMFGYEGKNKIKFYNSDAKVHKSAVGSFPDHHKAEFDKKKKTTTIHLKKSVDKDTASKVGRFNSNWQTQADYHESTDYEDVIAEALSDVVVKKMQDMVGGADKMPRGAEFRKLKAKAQAAVKAERAGKKAEPKAQTTTKTAKGRVHKGSADAADRNLIMQLRKAQDIDGKMDIQVSPAGRTIRLSKKQIDMFLAKHDSLAKPVDKRKFKILLTKALRSKAK
jgi:hypothetical protein